jgi:4-amino-4-deoxy-L-arabinose transferase-like glycosyltransferase
VTIPIYQRVLANSHRAAIIILLSGFLMRLFIAIWLNPGFDEAYYYLYTLHPDWSYFDHPLLVGISTNIGIWLTGQVSQFTIRIGTVLLYTGTLTYLYLATLRLYTIQVAINALAIASAIPIFQIAFGTLITPDTPLLFFWALTLWLAVQEFFTDRVYRPSYRLTLICLTVGLACLGKYHGFILGLGLVGFCLFSPNFRRALSSKWLLLGIPIFLLVISPLLYWNFTHNWVSFLFQSNRAVPDGSYHFDRVILVILVEMLYLFPVFGFPLLWSVIRATLQQLKNFNWWRHDRINGFDLQWNLEKRALLLWLSVPLILGFTLISGYQQILPSWKMPGYWSATILLAERISIKQRYSYPRTLYRWFFGSIGVIILLLSIALAHIEVGAFQIPSKSAIIGLLPIKGDNSTQLFDIQQLRQGLSNNPQFSQALKSTDFVFTNRYYLGGQIGMAIEPTFHKPITCFDEDLRGFAFWSKPTQWLGKNAIYLGTKTFEVDLDVNQRYSSYFQKITKLGELPILRGGEVVETFSIYQAQKLLKPYPRPYGNS